MPAGRIQQVVAVDDRGYGMNARSSGSIDVGVSKNGPGPSGSIVMAPSLAKNVAICRWAASAYAAPAPMMFVRKLCGFLLTAGFAANARSLRKRVALDASAPARRIAVAVGFGTVLSPRANWMITGRVISGAYAAGLADCCAHSVLSIRAWIADAPGTVSTRSGRSRSGMFSTNDVNAASGTAL